MLFNKALDPSLLFLRTCDSSRFRVDRNAGLTLKLAPETCMELKHPSFIGKRQQHLFCQTETDVTFSTTADNEKAGLIIFQDEKHFYYLCKSSVKGKPFVQLYKSNPEADSMDLLTQVPLENGINSVKLRIDARGNFYDFYFSAKAQQWTLLKDNLDASFLSTRVAGGFIGCVFAMYATSSGKQTTNHASFKSLRYRGRDPMYK
jgi:alpha-N-arabinofuranosidase